MDFVVSRATGTAERDAVPVMMDDARQRGFRPRSLGADKGYDTKECVRAMRNRGVTSHVAQRTHSAIDGRTTRHRGYGKSQKIRKQVEEIFGWMKTVGGLRRSRYRGVERTGWRDTWWLRPTTWCGWPTHCRERGPGPSSQRDLPGERYAQNGRTGPLRDLQIAPRPDWGAQVQRHPPKNVVTASINRPCRTG